MNYILIGFKGAGKSTIGKALSAAKKLPFIDLDVVIEDIYSSSHSSSHERRTCRQIYQIHGEIFFRDLEAEALRSLKAIDRSVIATGGGVLDRLENADALSSLGKIIYLDEEKEILRKRLSHEKIAFLAEEGSFEKLFNKRTANYNHTADLRISVSGKSQEQVVKEIMQ